MNPFETILFYLENFAFVRYALIVGVLIAFCASLLGVTLVLKRYSFIGDGLSHVAFGAMSVAAVLNVSNDLYLIMPVTIIADGHLYTEVAYRKLTNEEIEAMQNAEDEE